MPRHDPEEFDLTQVVIERKRGKVERADRPAIKLLEQYMTQNWQDVITYGALCGYEYELLTSTKE